MKKYKYILIGVAILALLGVVGLAKNQQVFGGNFSLWKIGSKILQPSSGSWSVKIPSLSGSGTTLVTASSDGTLSTTTFVSASNPNGRWSTTTDDSAIFAVDTTWNVGVGTTTPRYTFDTNGKGRFISGLEDTAIGADVASTAEFTNSTSTNGVFITEIHSLGTLIIDGLATLVDLIVTDTTTTNITIISITGDAESCLQADANGLVSGTGSACGAGGGGGALQTLTFGGQWNTIDSFLRANGSGDEPDNSVIFHAAYPVAKTGTINVMAFLHSGDLSSNNMDIHILVNGVTQATSTVTGATDTVDAFTGLGISVSQGDYVNVRYHSGATIPDRSILTIVIE